MRIALAFLLIPFWAPAQEVAGGLTGSLIDQASASIARAVVEIDSGTKKYQVRTDDAGIYKFSNLPPGKYSLTFTREWFMPLTVRSVELSEREAKRIPEITLAQELFCQFPPRRDFVRLLPGDLLGELSGSVLPAAAGVEVILICRTFRACGSTKTDSTGHFSFEKLSAGAYGLSFRRDGFFPEDATGYEYYVNAGAESVYAPQWLQQCPDGNCKVKIERILPGCA